MEEEENSCIMNTAIKICTFVEMFSSIRNESWVVGSSSVKNRCFCLSFFLVCNGY